MIKQNDVKKLCVVCGKQTDGSYPANKVDGLKEDITVCLDCYKSNRLLDWLENFKK